MLFAVGEREAAVGALRALLPAPPGLVEHRLDDDVAILEEAPPPGHAELLVAKFQQDKARACLASTACGARGAAMRVAAAARCGAPRILRSRRARARCGAPDAPMSQTVRVVVAGTVKDEWGCGGLTEALQLINERTAHYGVAAVKDPNGLSQLV